MVTVALGCTADLPSSALQVCEPGPRAGVSCSSWAVSWKDLAFFQPLANAIMTLWDKDLGKAVSEATRWCPRSSLLSFLSPVCPHAPPGSLVTPRPQTPREWAATAMQDIPSHDCLLLLGWRLWHSSKVCAMAQMPPAPVKRWGQDRLPSFASMMSGAIASSDTNVLARTVHARERRVAADTITGSEWHLKCKISQMLGTAWNCHHFLSPFRNGILSWVWENLQCVCGEKNPLHHMLLLFSTMSGNWWRLRYCSFCVLGFCRGQDLQCTVNYHWEFIKRKGAAQRAPVIAKRREECEPSVCPLAWFLDKPDSNYCEG